MCSSHATVRGLLHELDASNRTVVVDTEASPEHLSRATTEAVDLMLVVAEPFFKSLETARRYSGLGVDLGIPRVVLVANKVRDRGDAEAIEQYCSLHDLPLFGTVPFDRQLGSAEQAAAAPIDHSPEAPSIVAIEEMTRSILDGAADTGR